MSYGDTATLLRMVSNDPEFHANDTLAAALASPGRPGGTVQDGQMKQHNRHLVSTLTFHIADLNKVAQWETNHTVIGKQGARNYGQCGALAQRATETTANESSLGLARWWLQGPRVLGNNAVPLGAAIAAGWIDGRFPNDGSHTVSNTSMIFIEFVNNGFKGYHQWKRLDDSYSGVRVDTRLSGDGVYGAENFYVILTVRRARGVVGLSNLDDNSSHHGSPF